jgi:hypothetical protein
MAIRKANPAQGNGKAPDAQAMALAEVERLDKPKPENRYLRGMRVIAEDISVSADEIAKQADMSKSGAKACIIAWNTAVRLLDQKNALATSAAELLNNSLTKAVKAPEVAGLAELGLEMIPDGNGGWRVEKRV